MITLQKYLRLLIFLVAILVFGIMAGSALNSAPALAQTAYQTPTPDAEGKIYYTVVENEWCTQIQLKTNVTVDQIIKLNNLDEACTIYAGQKLLLGTVEAPALTETAMPTPTLAANQITPTATPVAGFARICVVLFNDLDGTGMRTDGETYLYGGVVSVNDRLGKVSLTGNTVAGNPDEVEPLCFEEIPEGSYNITVAIPDGFNATTITNYPLDVKAGEQATVDFGAQVNSVVAEEAQATGSRIPILGIVGLVILLSGLGLGFYLWRQRRV